MKLSIILSGLAACVGLAAAGRLWWRDYRPVRPDSPPVPGHATLGAHTLVGHEERRSPRVARTRPLVTAKQGSWLIAFVAGYTGNHSVPSDSYDNRWDALGAPVSYEGYEGRFEVQPFGVRTVRGGPGHRVEVSKISNPRGELTMPVVEVRDAVLTDMVQSYAPAGPRLTSGSVRTRGPAVLVAYWWGDGRALANEAVPDDGFQIIDEFLMLPENSGVQCAVAVREVTAAGEYRVSWATAPAQGAVLWLFAFEYRTP
jgi:hypothetical protein